MLYIYDILVNFMDGDRIYEFFEWNSKDIIEHIKKIPVVKVDNKTFSDIINNEVEVDNSFLELIKNKASTYKETIKYACIITNSERCYATEFNKEGNVLFKSSLLIDEEEEIIECSKKLPVCKITYNLLSKINKATKTYTRKEEKEVNIIRRELITTYTLKNFPKINYLYEEVYGKDNLTDENKYHRLLDDIDNNLLPNTKKILQIINLSNKKKKLI